MVLVLGEGYVEDLLMLIEFYVLEGVLVLGFVFWVGGVDVDLFLLF